MKNNSGNSQLASVNG